MRWIVSILTKIKDAYDWAAFLEVARVVIESKLGTGALSALVGALAGAWAGATWYEIILMALLCFVAIQVVAILRILKRPKGLVLTFEDAKPFVFEASSGGTTYRCYRFRVHNQTGELIGACKAQVARVVTDLGEVSVGIPFSLRRSHSHSETFALRGGEEKYVDLIAVPIAGEKQLYPARFADLDAAQWPEMGPSGACLPQASATLTIQVLSDARPSRMILRYEQAKGEWRLRPA